MYDFTTYKGISFFQKDDIGKRRHIDRYIIVFLKSFKTQYI